MENIRKAKFVITGYYEVDMSRAQEDYDTTDPDEMLKIDHENIVNYPEAMLIDTDFVVELNWVD